MILSEYDKYLVALLRPLLEDPKRGKLGHHLKYDAHVRANHGIERAGIRHDQLR